MGWNTHEVTNQVPDLVNHNLYASDTVLQQAVEREGAHHAHARLSDYGEQLGRSQVLSLAGEIDRQPPVLRPYDRQGHRIDEVTFHPGWHTFLQMGCRYGLNAGASVARAAAFLLHGQVESGSLCPLTMTSAALPLLARESWYSALSAQIESSEHDPRDIPIPKKRGMLVGMGLTEKQGGSDLRRITTQAQPLAHAQTVTEGEWYQLMGHKWFFSAPMADAHLVLAQLDGQPTCFFVPRWLPDGTRNAVRIMQLKDKLGNRSNASAEVEFHDALGMPVGEAGRGIATLVEMAAYTRLDCVLGSTALMRAALVQALHHAKYRIAFGQPLMQQPLMRTLLVDLALEVEAAVTLSLRLARAVENQANADPLERALARIITPAAKFWICKRAISLVAEAMEVLGGNGYVETHVLPRLYREAPVNSIWEGSGNVMCLDVLRGLQRHPEWADALFGWLRTETASDALLLAQVTSLETYSQRPDTELEAVARHIASKLTLLVQVVMLKKHAPEFVADAFRASRFAECEIGVFGMSSAPTALNSILERAWRTDV